MFVGGVEIPQSLKVNSVYVSKKSDKSAHVLMIQKKKEDKCESETKALMSQLLSTISLFKCIDAIMKMKFNTAMLRSVYFT